MQILWIKSDFVDPPDTGGKIRTYNLLCELNKRCHVTYIALKNTAGVSSQADTTHWATRVITYPFQEEQKAGIGFALRVLARMLSRHPYIVQKYHSPEIKKCQQELVSSAGEASECGEETVLICDFLEMTDNVNWSLPCPKILFQHNVESVIWRRYFENERHLLKKAYFWFEHQRMKRYEGRVCNRFDLVIAVSPRDQEVLQRQLGVTAPIKVIDTGVDTEYFTPPADSPSVPGRLLFLGSLDWMPNIDGITWFVREIYPSIKQACPEVALDIVGRRPTAAVHSLAGNDDSITIHGSVPDVRPYITHADVFIVPLRVGSGTRLKIFEAMAMERSVVSTTIGAEGLPVEDGRHLVLADSSEAYATAVVSLLQDSQRKLALAEAGRALVCQKHSWAVIGEKLRQMCSQLVGKKTEEACIT